MLVEAIMVGARKHHPSKEPQQVHLQVPADPPVLGIVSKVLSLEKEEPSFCQIVLVSKLNLRWLVLTRLDNPSKPV